MCASLPGFSHLLLRLSNNSTNTHMFLFLKWLSLVCAPCMCLQYLWRPEDGIRFSGTRIAGHCELPSMSAGNWTQVFCKSSIALNGAHIWAPGVSWSNQADNWYLLWPLWVTTTWVTVIFPSMFSSKDFVVLFHLSVCLSRQGSSVWQSWLSWNSLCRPGRPWTHRDPPMAF